MMNDDYKEFRVDVTYRFPPEISEPLQQTIILDALTVGQAKTLGISRSIREMMLHPEYKKVFIESPSCQITAEARSWDGF